MCIFVQAYGKEFKEPSLVFNMATTDEVVFREIGLGVLQFCFAYSLFITIHTYITTAAAALPMCKL